MEKIMPDYSTRTLIDFAADDDGAKFREALYGEIHDRIANHIEAKKREIASSIIGQNESVMTVDEAMFPGSAEYDKKFPKEPAAKFDKKKVSTGTVYTKKTDKEKLTKEDFENLDEDSKKKIIEDFIQTEEYEQLDELSKNTLKSYVRHSVRDVGELKSKEGVEKDRNGGKNTDQSRKDLTKSFKRRWGINKALDRMTKEETDLTESKKEENPITGKRKIATYEEGRHKIEVRYQPEYSEYSIHPYTDGKHWGEPSVGYPGSSKEDAHEEAKHQLKDMVAGHYAK